MNHKKLVRALLALGLLASERPAMCFGIEVLKEKYTQILKGAEELAKEAQTVLSTKTNDYLTTPLCMIEEPEFKVLVENLADRRASTTQVHTSVPQEHIHSFAQETRIAEIIAYATPKQLFMHSALWALGTKMQKDGLSIKNTAGLTLASLLGTLGTTAVQRMAYLKGSDKVIPLPSCIKKHAPALENYMPKRKKIVLIASVLPYLAGQNAEAILNGCKHVKENGVGQSFKDAGKAIKKFWSKETSLLARWNFVARNLGPIATILLENRFKWELNHQYNKGQADIYTALTNGNATLEDSLNGLIAYHKNQTQTHLDDNEGSDLGL